MSVEYSFKDNELIITSPVLKSIKFEAPIRYVELVEHILVVVIRGIVKTFNRNVFGVNQHGEIVWQIEEQNNMPFVNLYWENGEFYVGNWSGYEYNIDAKTGKVIKAVFKK